MPTLPGRMLMVVGCAALLLGAPSMSAGSRVAGRQATTAGAPAPFEDEAAAIFAVLNRQAADWNRGDLDAFAAGYKNAPDILFIGRTVEHGYDNMLKSYKAHYPTPESMGVLSFTQLDAERLDAHFATATGHFHLQRTAAGGGNADGYFLLVLEKTPQGWKVVRDDTTATPATHP